MMLMVSVSSLLALLPLNEAVAGSFSVNPVRVELSANQTSAVIQVTNAGADAVTIEVRPFSWSQSNGKDKLAPTREIIVTPQVFRLKSGATQILRVGALRKPDPAEEIPYRLILDEIPPPPAADFKGLQVALRINMPVFLKSAIDAKEKIDVALLMEEGQRVRMRLSNSGKAAAYFSQFSLYFEDEPDKMVGSQTDSTYVLPGQQKELLLKVSAFDPAKKMLIKAQSYAGPVEFHAVPVSR